MLCFAVLLMSCYAIAVLPVPCGVVWLYADLTLSPPPVRRGDLRRATTHEQIDGDGGPGPEKRKNIVGRELAVTNNAAGCV